MGQGVAISVPFDPDGLQYLDQFKAASAEANRRLALLDKEMNALIKKGQAIGDLRLERYA